MDEYQSPKEDNTQRWIITGCIIAVILFVCCAAASVGGIYWLGSLSTSGLADITVNAPTSVDIGQPYSITVVVRNISDKEISLNSIDIEKNILNGLIVATVTPSYTDTYEYDASGKTYQTYSFEQGIAPGESLTVTFEGEAALAGDFGGDVDVCINSFFNCFTGYVRTLVK